MYAPTLNELVADLRSSADTLVPTSRVVDVLLDIRNDEPAREVRRAIDDDLRSIGRRQVLTVVEAHVLLDDLQRTVQRLHPTANAS